MVKITKIVERTLGKDNQNDDVQNSKELLNIFGSKEKEKKTVEKVEFSDKLGSVFGVTEPRPQEDG